MQGGACSEGESQLTLSLIESRLLAVSLLSPSRAGCYFMSIRVRVLPCSEEERALMNQREEELEGCAFLPIFHPRFCP